MKQLTKFKQTLKTNNYSDRTIEIYLYWIEELLKFTKKPIKDTTQQDITSFFNKKRKNINANSLPVLKSAFKLFFEKYLKMKDLFDDSIKVRTTHKKEIISVLKEQEIKQLLDAVTKENIIRNQLAIQLSYDASLRVSDIQKLEYKNIHQNGNILIRGGKGKKDRITVWELKKTNTLLQEYLQQATPKKYLFEKKNGKTYHTEFFQSILRQAGVNSAINHASWGWHLLRHSGAVRWSKNKVPLNIIKDRLGHAFLGTTGIYLEDKLKEI